VKSEDEVYVVVTQPTEFHRVKDALAAAGIAFEGAEITYMPNNTVAVDADVGAKVLKLIDALEDNDDVQNVSHNAELPESLG
jgi:transcriptional/translational regulatory protein YebC/TACO1